MSILRLALSLLLTATSRAPHATAQASPRPPATRPVLEIFRIHGWHGERTDSLRVSVSGQAKYTGLGYGPRRGYWHGTVSVAATDSLVAQLKPLLLTEEAHRAATLPRDAVQICELGPAAIYSFLQDHKSLIYRRHCYEMGGAIDSIVNRFILRHEWRLSPTQ